MSKYYQISLGYVRGGMNEEYIETTRLYFELKSKRDDFYNALGGENKRGCGGMDITLQITFGGFTNHFNQTSFPDHMYKIDPIKEKCPLLYDLFDLSTIKFRKRY